MLIKTKESVTSQTLGSRDFWQKLFSTKVNLLYLLYSTAQRNCLLHFMNQNCFLKTFLRTLIFMTLVSLYLFSFAELMWNYHISITPKMVKKVIANLNSSKVSGLDCIPVVLKELWTWGFIHTSCTLQYLSEGVFFSRLLEDPISGPST